MLVPRGFLLKASFQEKSNYIAVKMEIVFKCLYSWFQRLKQRHNLLLLVVG